MPPYHASVPQPTPSPAGDMSPGGGGGGGGGQHAHMPSGSPPMSGGQGWPPPVPPPVPHGGYSGFPPHHPMAAHHHHQHGVHPQDIKPLPMHGSAAGQQMPFQQYSWYQQQATAAASDGSMNAGLLT